MKTAMIYFSNNENQVTEYEINDLAETMFLLIMPTEKYKEAVLSLCKMSCDIILLFISSL